jgi:glycosyltransferase involved in cell wall biosynthesis
MVASSKLPSITFIIPTLNAASVLIDCLQSIVSQDYPRHLLTILIVDGGSTDSTLKIARLYKCKVIENPLKTGEAGKAVGVSNSHSDLVALIDSDNILPTTNWLLNMVTPFIEDPRIIGTEPWSFTYRPQAGFIERYCSLIGANDPFTFIAGTFDRQNIITGRWTGLKINIVDHRYYQTIKLNRATSLPTLGANGTVYKTKIIKKYIDHKYLFDVDVIPTILNNLKTIHFAKVKIGIVHTYCESSIPKFYKKQLRRATDLYTYQKVRQFHPTNNTLLSIIKFSLYSSTLVPPIIDMMVGIFKKPDIAWLFHPIACTLTLYTYAIQTIKFQLGILKPINRRSWSQ